MLKLKSAETRSWSELDIEGQEGLAKGRWQSSKEPARGL